VTTFALDNVEQLQDVTKYRAWTTWLRDTIVASGWVQTSDTGQMDPATVAFPASSTFSLPMLFRMNDALQATFPVIMKIEPGQGAAAGSTTARIAVGSTTNGAGVFTGNSIGPGTNLTGSNPAGLNKLHRASGASNRFTCALWAQQYGVSAVAGCALTTGVAASPIGTLDVTELATSVRGTTAAAFPVYPSSSRPTLAALNLLSTIDLDFATLVPVSITHYGAARLYLPMGKWSVSGMSRHLASSVTDASTALMRWE
jgi:hypothetical protein